MKHTLVLTHPCWKLLKEKIIEDYGRATVLISWRLKANLGFTVRSHQDYQPDASWDQENTIRLDFYDEQLQTLFLLKYGEFVSTYETT
jgi:hypothetical protein